MLSHEQKTKIIEILDTSIKNLSKNLDLPESSVSVGIWDTLHQISEVDKLVADFMHVIMDHETASTCDDLPFTDKEHAEAVLEWLEHMKRVIERN